MSAFKELKECSNALEEQLKLETATFFDADNDRSFEEVVLKKVEELMFYQSKLLLLNSKLRAQHPELIARAGNSENIKEDYSDTAVCRVLIDKIVKFMEQGRAVKSLITQPDAELDPFVLDRKQRIIVQMKELQDLESQMLTLDTVYAQKVEEHSDLSKQWHQELGELVERKAKSEHRTEPQDSGPLYEKLDGLVKKMELMRALISKLIVSPSNAYDWLKDPKDFVASVLPVIRDPITVQKFIDN